MNAQQNDSIPLDPRALKITNASVAALGGGSLLGLSTAWYKDGREHFKFFDDDDEWLQMDKVGHVTTTYNLTLIIADQYRYAGLERKKAAFRSATITFLYMGMVELFDGFAKGYGFSPSDMVANEIGCFAGYLSASTNSTKKISLKYSFHQTRFSDVNPNLLGSNTLEQMLKDYNGQTYWLSYPLGIPKAEWVCLSLGYSGEEMIRARKEQSLAAGYSPYRQWYLSADLDLTMLPIKGKALKRIVSVFRFIKLPFPAVELNKGKLNVKPLYF